MVTTLPDYSWCCYEVSSLSSFLLLCDSLPSGCRFLLIVVGEGVVTCGSETEGWIPGVAKTVRCTGAGSLPNIDPALPEGMVLTGYAVNGSPKYPFTRNVFTITSGEDTGYLYISGTCFSLFLWSSELETHEAGMRCSDAGDLQGSRFHAHSLRS